MKIPDSQNSGYYVTEETVQAQWQANGMLIDGVVQNIGSVVAGGDAPYIHAPMYSMPRNMPPPGPGYVMGGPYFQVPPEDFSEYMWMENEEEFDKQVMQQLEEEALMEQCIEAMLDEERRSALKNTVEVGLAEAVSRSTLNPLAAEFVPTFSTSKADERLQEPLQKPPPSATDVSTPSSNTSTNETSSTCSVVAKQSTDDTSKKADACSTQASCELKECKSEQNTDSTEGQSHQNHDTKKLNKVTRSSENVPKDVAKKVEIPAAVKADSSECHSPVVSAQPSTSDVALAPPKPINYAAAARANKPKKATPPPSVVVESKASETKPASKPTSRKNSAK